MIKEFRASLLSNRVDIVFSENYIKRKLEIPFELTDETSPSNPAISDIFYVPKSKFKVFHYFSSLFRRNNLFFGDLEVFVLNNFRYCLTNYSL